MNLLAVEDEGEASWTWGNPCPAVTDPEERMAAIEGFLRSSPRLARLLPPGFALGWYL